MIAKVNKNAVRKKRHIRIRKNVYGTAAIPRLNIYRSEKHIYAQIVDDDARSTLVSSSTIAKGIDVEGKTKSEAARIVGADLAKKALAKGIESVVFDRGGYLYTGRVKAIADGARENGLKF